LLDGHFGLAARSGEGGIGDVPAREWKGHDRRGGRVEIVPEQARVGAGEGVAAFGELLQTTGVLAFAPNLLQVLPQTLEAVPGGVARQPRQEGVDRLSEGAGPSHEVMLPNP
jgi:hypothetical protein